MENNYYGAPENTDSKTLGERLRDYYDPSDFVQVINIDTEPLKYQFMPPENQQFISNAPYHGETHNIKPPQVVVLQPGDTKLCPAHEADAMITVLIKKLATKNTNSKIQSGELSERVATTNWTDPQTQEAFIKRIFLGKQDLVSQFNQSKPNVDKDLEVARPGRPRKAIQES